MKSACVLLLFLSCFSVAGCGNPASPQPPSLHLAKPVADLAAARTGDRVRLSWTMSTRTTDNLLLKGVQQVQICRGPRNGPCLVVGATRRDAGVAAQYDDRLPAALGTGAPRLLRYQVRLMNHNARSAGDSNPAYAAAGEAPPRVADVLAASTARGILVHWSTTGSTLEPPIGARLFVRLTRTRILHKDKAKQPKEQETRSGSPQPLIQTLEAPETATVVDSWSPRQVLDTTAPMERLYRYSVQLFARETVDGVTQELAGDAATSLPTLAKDTFPPAIPTDLAAVADPGSRTIDLSWTPSAGSDTAGYFVYRRIAGSEDAPIRVSGTRPIAQPGWSDHAAQPATRYAYSVSAVDASGNESGRSSEAQEQLNAKAE